MNKTQADILYFLAGSIARGAKVGDVDAYAYSFSKEHTSKHKLKAIREMQFHGIVKCFDANLPLVYYVCLAKDADKFAAAGWKELHLNENLEFIGV